MESEDELAEPLGALHGLRVIDVSSTFLAPYCTMLLGQWGAEVIKVEPPEGDIVRGIDDEAGDGLGSIFLNVNRGKRSIVLDLKHQRGRQALQRLVAGADVFVHNLRPDTADRLGLASSDIRAMNSDIIYCGFRGFGSGGPYESLPAYDDVIQAACGMAALQGGDGPPQYVKSSIADKIVGAIGAAALLAALHGRDQDGRGRTLEIPMFETMVGFTLLEQQGGYTFEPRRGGTGYARTASPYRRPFETLDGHVAVMIYTDAQWRSFFDLIGKPELTTDPRFASIRERTRHSDELYGLVESELLALRSHEWLKAFRQLGIPAGPVNSIESLFEDPHLLATEFFQYIDHPDSGRVVLGRTPGPVRTMDATPAVAPRLGEHTNEILAEVGFTPREIDDLLAAGIARQSSAETSTHPG